MGSAMDKRTTGTMNPLVSQLRATRHKEGLCSREGEEDTAMVLRDVFDAETAEVSMSRP